MNPAVVGALAQWIITGLPELIAALNQGQAKVTTTTTTASVPPPVADTSTGWPPSVGPATVHDGGDEGVKLVQTFLVALGAPIQIDGFSGPATLGALNSLAAKLKAAGGSLA